MSHRNPRAFLLAGLALLLAACTSSPMEISGDESVELSTSTELVEALRARGAVVEDLGEVITAVFSIPGRALRVNGESVQAYEFPDETAATAEVPRLTESLIHWAAPVRLYQDGGLLVLLAGTDEGVAALLRQLLGPPVASLP